jgi:hypothetical protein
MKKLIPYTLYLIFIIAVGSAVWSWYNPKIISTPEYIKVNVPVPYKVISKVTVTVTKVVVMEKQVVVTKEVWPDWFTKDENKQLTAIGDVPPYKGVTRIASIIDTKSGETQLVQNRLPMSLFSFENEKRIGVRYGKTDKGTDLNFYADWTFFRVGNIYVAGYAEAGNGYKAMLDASYRF